MKCIKFERFLPIGATRPFIARDSDSNKWVIKFIGNPLGTKAVFNELITSILANSIQLPWPDVSICHLSTQIIQRVQDEKLKVQSDWAIAIQYIEGLQHVNWPEGGYNPQKNFKQRNAQHIHTKFSKLNDFNVFYGKAIFDNWVLLEDRKYDTLLKTKEGYPIFLDASAAFYGFDWNIDELVWNRTSIDIKSPYLEGIVTEFERFDKWIETLQREFKVNLLPKYEDIPASWNIPRDYYSALKDFLSTTQEVFVQIFREWVDIHKY